MTLADLVRPQARRSSSRAWALLACVVLAACSTPPATLKAAAARAARADARADLGSLCETIARDPRTPEAERALGELVHRWPRRRDPEAWRAAGCRVAFDATGPGMFSPDYFDELTPADRFTVTRLPQHRRAGVGVALLGLRENRHLEAIERHYPPEAITRPVTALAEVETRPDGTRAIRIRLFSALYHESALVDGRPQMLAADFSVPWVALLERAGALRGSWLSGLLDSQPKREAQLYLMEPYDPRKTPLLLVHGLIATPAAWAETTNQLWADPAARRRYQVWHYHYPTSAPWLVVPTGHRAFEHPAAVAEIRRILGLP